MDIRVEIVAGDRRMVVYDLGPVEAPQSLNDFALPRATVHAMVATVQHACAGLREEALRAKALDLCRANPQIRLKDYRRRNVPTLFGTLAVRVPRLLDRRTGTRRDLLADETGTGSEGLPALLARLGAWMSYRYAAGFLAELFPLAGNLTPNASGARLWRQLALPHWPKWRILPVPPRGASGSTSASIPPSCAATTAPRDVTIKGSSRQRYVWRHRNSGNSLQHIGNSDFSSPQNWIDFAASI
ncbi:hypothetical protein [Hoeflea sp.]|uniref:hypothetical protein n=1 Tax=Hoeflea sp. TaxID=1940281 RepID=UPI0019C6366C|nr:hypothetical protein [Hoeflea sp.]MBC7281960.1 hypothetical protein [Hoeflea sp.]